MTHPQAKQPTAMEIENLIYEVATNRVLVQILMTELSKTNPELISRVEMILSTKPQTVYDFVSQFVETPSPYYAPLLAARKDMTDASEAAEVLKQLLKPPPDSPPEAV